MNDFDYSYSRAGKKNPSLYKINALVGWNHNQSSVAFLKCIWDQLWNSHICFQESSSDFYVTPSRNASKLYVGET